MPRFVPSGPAQCYLPPLSSDASTAQSPVPRQYGRARAPTGSSLIPMLDYPRALASSPVLSRSRPTHASRTSMSLSTKRGSYQLVPQRAYSTHFGVSNGKIIPFQLVGAKEPGVPMRMLINEDAVDAPIVGPHDFPFDETVPSTITLRIWVSSCLTSRVCLLLIFILSGLDMKYTQDGEHPLSPRFILPGF